jgi:hypothetical protein
VLKGGKKPTGGNVSGDTCIKNAYKKLGLPMPSGLRFVEQLMRRNNFEEFYGSANHGSSSYDDAATAADAMTMPETTSSRNHRRRRASKLDPSQIGGTDAEQAMACSTNVLLFARGTTEFGVLGTTVGPALSSSLSSGGWMATGIDYSAILAASIVWA